MIPIFSIRTVIDCLPDTCTQSVVKGSNLSLAADIAKVVIRYAH